MTAVILFGTRHSLQNAAPGSREEAALRKLLLGLCEQYKVRAIAEEASEETLVQSGVESSVPMGVAKTLNVPHRFCDPNTEERKRLGLALDHNSVEAGAWLKKGSTPESIAAEVAVEHRKREKVWLDRLHAFDTWPALFVCGANHTAGFAAMLERHGVQVVVGAEDWEPVDVVKGANKK